MIFKVLLKGLCECFLLYYVDHINEEKSQCLESTFTEQVFISIAPVFWPVFVCLRLLYTGLTL